MLPADKLFFIASEVPTSAVKSLLEPLIVVPLLSVSVPPLVAMEFGFVVPVTDVRGVKAGRAVILAVDGSPLSADGLLNRFWRVPKLPRFNDDTKLVSVVPSWSLRVAVVLTIWAVELMVAI